MSDRDYYEILGLTPRADGAMVDQAYWHLARKYQSLAETNPRAQYMLDELNEAYGVLGNPRLREQYDAFRDDVLIRKGMVKPVKAKPHAAERRAESVRGKSEPRKLPTLRLPHARTYGLAAVIALLAFAAAWQGVHITIVALGLVAGLGLALTPVARDRLANISFSMPNVNVSVPQVQMPTLPQMPSLQVPKVEVPDIEAPALAGGGPEGMDAEELRRSTAETIARWRASIGLRAPAVDPDGPSRTLIDIVEGEQDLEAESEPLNAVLDILRGAHKKAGTPTS